MKLEIIRRSYDTNPETTSVLFIHGAYHGAWCWEENFIEYFYNKGFSTYAVSFRGHGKSEGHHKLNTFTLNDYIDDILKVIQSFKIKPVLIAHSMGGAVAQKILYLYPNKIKGIVLISSAPPNGISKDLLRGLYRNLKEYIKNLLFLKTENKNTDKDVFFSKELPSKKRIKYIRALQPESKKIIKELMGTIVPKTLKTEIPVLILGSEQDLCVSVKTIIETGKVYKSKPIIFSNVSHDMMLDPNWRMIADKIIVFLNEDVY
ncbi:alpha/beta hydrolase [Clostridium estertheticum]|uniref:alpha/beta hydrolase n=1 Tax=Clostridium estertheticum TaxID=238834 RepID=UPI0013EEB884|nr:alpha/beta hydrolase [Clostridium estertheticum]MBZ9609904.1 alpha/beta hydrolase [Clostridium estertheticum]